MAAVRGARSCESFQEGRGFVNTWPEGEMTSQCQAGQAPRARLEGEVTSAPYGA